MSGPETPSEYSAAMASLRRSLEKRITADERGPKPVASRVGYDWRRLGLDLRAMVAETGLPLRALGAEIGVTATDLSRLTSGTNVAIEKVFAACDWAGFDPRDYFQSQIKSTRCTSSHVKQDSVSRADRSPEATGHATARRTTGEPQSRPERKSRKAKP